MWHHCLAGSERPVNAGEYRKAIDLAINIAKVPADSACQPTFENQMCVFAGALIGALDKGDPALARRIRVFTDQAIKASRVVSAGTGA